MQKVFIVNFNSLYEILDEIKENLFFKIIKLESENNIKNNSDLNVVYIDVSDLDFVESDEDYAKLLFRIKNNLAESFKELPY